MRKIRTFYPPFDPNSDIIDLGLVEFTDTRPSIIGYIPVSGAILASKICNVAADRLKHIVNKEVYQIMTDIYGEDVEYELTGVHE